MRLLVAAVSLLAVGSLSGCMSVADINASFRRIDYAWSLEYQKTEDEFRARVVEAPYPVVYESVKKTFLDLGMPLIERSPIDGALSARNTAPTPLSLDEWKEVAKRESPRMQEIAGSLFRLKDDPKEYIVTVSAVTKTIGNDKTMIVLSYQLDAPQYRAYGLEPSKTAPPAAVQLASLKFWAALNVRLSEAKLPDVRQRKSTELAI